MVKIKPYPQSSAPPKTMFVSRCSADCCRLFRMYIVHVMIDDKLCCTLHNVTNAISSLTTGNVSFRCPILTILNDSNKCVLTYLKSVFSFYSHATNREHLKYYYEVLHERLSLKFFLFAQILDKI
jgi:hypothetical protein